MKGIIIFFNFDTALCHTHSGYLTWSLNIKEAIKAQNINFLTYNLNVAFGIEDVLRITIFFFII